MSNYFSISDFEDLITRIDQISDFDIFRLYKNNNDKDLKKQLDKIKNQLLKNDVLLPDQIRLIRHIKICIAQDYDDLEQKKVKSKRVFRKHTVASKRKNITEKTNWEHVRKPGTQYTHIDNNSNTITEQKTDSEKAITDNVYKKTQLSNKIKPIKEEPAKEKVFRPKIVNKVTEDRISNEKEEKESRTSNILKKFAYYADLPTGFSSETLKDIQNGSMIYQLILSTNTIGKFSISDNEAAQNKAMNNSSFLLEMACDYENAVGEGNRIITINKGEIIKSGKEWKITKKALIKFV